MTRSRAGLVLFAAAAPLLQGCVTEALWSAHYRQLVTVTCPARAEAFLAADPSQPDGPAGLWICYAFDPGVEAPSPGESPFPHPSGCIALEAPEADVRRVELLLAEAVGAGEGRLRSLEGSLAIEPDPERPGEAELVLSLTLLDAEGRDTFAQVVLRGAWRRESAVGPAGGHPLRLPPPGTVRIGLAHTREESNTALLVALTPLTVAIDVFTVVLYCLAHAH